MRTASKWILGLIIIAYPFLVYWGIKQNSISLLAATLIVIAGLRLVLIKSFSGTTVNTATLTAVILLIIAALALIMQNTSWLKLYPVAVNAVLLFFFTLSLLSDKPFIQRFAELREDNISVKKQRYMRKLTMVWCAFFLINGLISLYTWIYMSLEAWTLYNGLLSYLFMGILVVTELAYRYLVVLKRPQ